MKHVRVEEVPGPKSGKTRRWEVTSRHNHSMLGIIQWWAPWRRYVFNPAFPTAFEQDCLRDIALFIETETAEHKANR